MYKSNTVTMINNVMLYVLLGVITNMYCINALIIPRDNVHIEYADVENVTVYEDMINDDAKEYIPIDIDLNECVKNIDCVVIYMECISNTDDCISKYDECMVNVTKCNIKDTYTYSSPNANENMSFIDLNVVASNIKLGDFANNRDALIVNFKQYINAIMKLYDTSSSCYNASYATYDKYVDNNVYILEIAKNINKTATNIYNIVDSEIANLDMLYADKEIRDFLDLWVAYRMYGIAKYIDQILHFTNGKYGI